MILHKKGQSSVELTVIAMAVILGIIVGGPYVLRSINAHFKLWDTAAQESNEDQLTRATKDQIGLTGGPCTYVSSNPTPNCGIHGCGPLQREYIKQYSPSGCATGTECKNDDSCCSTPVATNQCWRASLETHLAPSSALTSALTAQGFKNTCTTSDLIYRFSCGDNAGLELCKEHLSPDSDGPRDCTPICRSTELIQHALMCNPSKSQWAGLPADTSLPPPVATQANCSGTCDQYCEPGYHYIPSEATKCIKCGDGHCDADENCRSCPCDCTSCPATNLTVEFSGTTPGYCSNHDPNGCIPGIPQTGPLALKTFTVTYEGDYKFTAHVQADRQYWFLQAEPTLTGPGYSYFRLFNRHNTNRCNGSDALKPDSTHENECAGATFYGGGNATVDATSDTFHLTPGDYFITLEYDNRWGYEWHKSNIQSYKVTIIAPPAPPTACGTTTPTTTATSTPTDLYYNKWCFQKGPSTAYFTIPDPDPGAIGPSGCFHGNDDCGIDGGCGWHNPGDVVNYHGGTITCISSPAPTLIPASACVPKGCPSGQYDDGSGNCLPDVYNDWCYRDASSARRLVGGSGVLTTPGCDVNTPCGSFTCGHYAPGTILTSGSVSIECLSKSTPVTDSDCTATPPPVTPPCTDGYSDGYGGCIKGT